MAELVKAFEFQIESIALLPSDGGKYEIMLDKTLIFSKLNLGRHAEPGEVLGLLEAQLGAP